MAQMIPALPDGFQIEQPSMDLPPLPDGFQIESQRAPDVSGVPPLPDGFELGPTIPDAEARNPLERLFVDPFWRGTDQAGMALQTGKAITGTMTVGDLMRAASEHRFQQQLNPQHPDDIAALEALSAEDGDWGSKFQTLFSNPQLIPQIITQSLPASVPSIAGGLAGGAAGGAAAGPAGGVVGGVGGAAAGSFMSEFLMSVNDAILENPAIDSEAQLQELLQNDEFMGRVKDHAIKRGMGVAAFDAISFGIAGRVFNPVAKATSKVAAPAVSRGAGAAAEVGTQAVTGASGEAAAQVLSEGEIARPGEVLLEGVAEVGTGVPEIGAAVLTRGAENLPALPDGFVLETEQVTEQVAPSTEQDLPNGKTDAPVQPPARSTDPAVQVQQPEPSAIPQTPTPPRMENTSPRTERIVTPDGQLETEVEFQVVDADSLKAAEGQVQPRDRVNRVGSGEQIKTIAANLDPLRLLGGRESDRGAPVVDETDVVLSGNGRLASIMLAAQDNPDRFAAYRATIEQMGYSTEGMKTPVLIRRAKGIKPDDKRRFAVGSNTEAGLALSASERARMEQDAISAEMLASFNSDVEDGVVAAANDGFVRQFLTNLPQSVRGSFYTADGKLSDEGAKRISNAIFAKAYGDEKLIAKATETSADPAIRNALLGAAGAWARMKEAAPDFDVTSDLVEAVGLINDARSKNMTVPQYLAQADAFREVSPRVQSLARLFLNKDQTRLAAWKDVRDRLKSYAESATSSGNADGDLLGNRPGPDETIQQIGQGIDRKATEPLPSGNNPGQGSELFPQGSTLSTGPKRGRGKAPAQKAAAGAMLDAMDAPGLDDAEDTTRKPRGTLAPRTQEVSMTNRASIYEEAYRAAGMTPDEGVLLTPERKRQVLRKLLVQTFGFKDVILDATRLKISTPDAVNQMLDAYRNVRFMMHVLALPVKGVSLDGSLTLQLERDAKRYFGVYRPDERSIGLPGRSNSFAHEWAHALDHYLMDRLQKNPKAGVLLTQQGRQGGLDLTNSIEEAFAKLINTMFFDEASLAAKVFQLEQAAAAVHKDGPKKGQPTKAALEAQAQIEKLTKGATRLRLKPSQYRQNSQDYQPGGDYYPSVHEMLARAFEAYVGHKLFLAGGTSEFVTKGEAAYLSDADARLAMTFPKGDDRVKIFSALDDVFDHLRAQQILGSEPAAGRPDDSDIMDPQHWNKIALAQGEPGLFQSLKQEAFAVRNVARNLFKPSAWKNGVSQIAVNTGANLQAVPKRVLDAAADQARFFFATSRAYMNARISRNKGSGAEFMSFIWDRFAVQPGSISTHKGPVFEEARQRAAERAANEIESLLKANGFKDALPEKEAEIVRGLMYGESPTGSTAPLKAVAAGLRRIMERVYAEGKKAGIEMGYVENKGYLPRVLLTNRIQQDPTKFSADAEGVYEIVYDQLTDDIEPAEMIRLARSTANRADPSGNQGLFKAEIAKVQAAQKKLDRAELELEKDASKIDLVNDAADELNEALAELVDAVRDTFKKVSAEAWTENVVAGDSATYDAHGPAADFTKTRTLPPEADEILKDWYETDPLTLVMSYTQKVTSRAAYVERAGQTGGAKDLNDVIRRKDVKDYLRAQPGKYNPDTPKGRLNILRDLANPASDNVLEMALGEATRAGAYGPDVRELRGMIEDFAGRRTRGPLADHVQRISGAAYVFTYIALLSRAAITGLTEPLTVMLRTGDLKATLGTFGAYLGEAVRAARSTQERAAIARAIGLVSTPLYDTVLMNRLSADSAEMFAGNRLMARFFRANLLTQLTDAQRRSTMVGGFLWMQSLAAEWSANGVNSGRKQIIEAEFLELGIGKDDLADFMDWLTQTKDLPSLDELDTSAGKLFANAVARFTDQTIQNPRRADKPVNAGNPLGAVVYSLTGFLYSFFSNVHAAIVTRTQRDYGILREQGFSKAEAAGAAGVNALWTFTSGFALLYAGQLIVSMAREAIFNGEQWEKKRADGELEEWISGLALSRTGIFGPGDIVMNAMTGLRYERDLSNLAVGAGPSFVMSQMQNIFRGLGWTGRNSPNTDTAEREALKSLYRLTLAPLSAGLLSALDTAGPVGTAGKYAGLTYLSSNSAASGFADIFLGPKSDDDEE